VSGDDDVEAAFAALYAGPAEDFVARRQDAVRALRQAGRREAAALVAKAAKPTAAAAALNRAVHAAPDRLEALFAATDAVARAQAAAGGTAEGRRAFQEALGAQRRALEAVVAEAARLARADGKPLGSALLDRIAGTLRAGAGSDEGRARLRAGRLTHDLEVDALPELLESLPLGPVAPARRETAAPQRAPAMGSPAPAGSAAAAREAQRQAAARAREAAAERARKEAAARARSAAVAALARAEASAERAARAEAAARERAERLREQLADAERGLAAAGAALDQARADVRAHRELLDALAPADDGDG
jgi:hypothetical protein